MAFDGYLIYIKNGSGSYEPFPLKYIKAESYKVSPNKRQDLDSGRNANGVLVRNVLSHMPSTISLEVAPMTNTALSTMMSFISNKYTLAKEKKLNIKYYCPDKDEYQTGFFYLPDLEYPIDRVIGTTITYKSWTLKFIEY